MDTPLDVKMIISSVFTFGFPMKKLQRKIAGEDALIYHSVRKLTQLIEKNGFNLMVLLFQAKFLTLYKFDA